MKAVEVFRFRDHIGGIVHDTENKSLHGVSWGSRRFYAWPIGADGRITNADAKPEELRVMNPAQYIDYQDCHYLGARQMLCSGSITIARKPMVRYSASAASRSSISRTIDRSGRSRSSSGRRRVSR
jgi:hypothetical protein